jgi:hypothetical protein
MGKRRFLSMVIAATVVAAGLALLLLDVLNPGVRPARILGRQYAGSYSDERPVGPTQQDEGATDLTGSVSGSLVDDRDAPITGVEVELMPLYTVGDQRWYATKRDWTNAQRRYMFAGVEPGEYIIAVQKSGAPEGRHPFAGTYYPGVDSETDADHK